MIMSEIMCVVFLGVTEKLGIYIYADWMVNCWLGGIMMPGERSGEKPFCSSQNSLTV